MQTRYHLLQHCNIQGVSWLVNITAEGDFLGLCDQKSSYKHVSDFGWLWSYGHFLIPIHALVWTRSYRTSWRVMYSTWWLIVCIASIIFATWLAHPATDSPVSVSRHLEGIKGMQGRWDGWVFVWTLCTAWLSYYYTYKNPYHLHYSDCWLLMFRTVWR